MNQETQFELRYIRREVHNYLGRLPAKLRDGTADASDCALLMGKLLVWLAGTLDKGEPPQFHPQSALKLGKDFQSVGLDLLEAKARGRLPQANDVTLARLRTVIDDLRDLERSVTHVLSK